MIGQHQWLVGKGNAGVGIALTTADNTDLCIIPILQKCTVIQAGVVISTAIVSGVSVVVQFDRVPKHAGSREAAFAEVTIPTGTVIGDIYWDIPTTVKTLYPGDTVVVQNSVCATDPAKAGACNPYLIVEPVPERPANVTGMHESA
jgi:hypothetical protein